MCYKGCCKGQEQSSGAKKGPVGLIRLKKDQEGSRRFKKVQEGSRRFYNVPEVSADFLEILILLLDVNFFNHLGKLRKFTEGSGNFKKTVVTSVTV